MDDSYLEYLYSESTSEQSAAGCSAQEYTAPTNRYFSLKVHGTKAAIEIKADTTRSGFKTVRIESATVSANSNGKNKRYDWEKKVAIQLTKTDILSFIAAMLLIKARAEFKHYGEKNDKSAMFDFQGGDGSNPRVFAQITQKSKPQMGIPIPLNDAIQIGHMALNEYTKNFPNVTSDSVIRTLERLASFNTNV